MSDALEFDCQIALLLNRDGFVSRPENGIPSALDEYHVAKIATSDSFILPHNMPGRRSWPLIGVVSIVIPLNLSSCSELAVIKNFVNLLLFHPESERLVRVLGWEPAGVLTELFYDLGTIRESAPRQLDSISCEHHKVSHEHVHAIGASASLWTFVLKLLVAYAPVDDSFILNSDSTNISNYLDAMVLETDLDIDMTITWETTTDAYDVISIPVFMGAVIPIVNLGTDIPLTLSVPTLAKIFTKKITMWNDPEIQALNKLVQLPNAPIAVVASVKGASDTVTAVFATLLEDDDANLTVSAFTWNQVPQTVPESEIVPTVEFTPYSIGYCLLMSWMMDRR